MSPLRAQSLIAGIAHEIGGSMKQEKAAGMRFEILSESRVSKRRGRVFVPFLSQNAPERNQLFRRNVGER
jgi:hypothetical protein